MNRRTPGPWRALSPPPQKSPALRGTPARGRADRSGGTRSLSCVSSNSRALISLRIADNRGSPACGRVRQAVLLFRPLSRPRRARACDPHETRWTPMIMLCLATKSTGRRRAMTGATLKRYIATIVCNPEPARRPRETPRKFSRLTMTRPCVRLTTGSEGAGSPRLVTSSFSPKTDAA